MEKINDILKVSLDNIKQMIDVNTIIGDKINISDTIQLIPVSRIRLGFLGGGGDLSKDEKPPFTGGSGATMSVTPIGFIVINNNEVTTLDFKDSSIADKLLESILYVFKRIDNKINKIGYKEEKL